VDGADEVGTDRGSGVPVELDRLNEYGDAFAESSFPPVEGAAPAPDAADAATGLLGGVMVPALEVAFDPSTAAIAVATAATSSSHDKARRYSAAAEDGGRP